MHGHTTGQTPAAFGKISFVTGLNVTDHIMIFSSWDGAVLGGVAMAPDRSFFGDLASTPPTMNTGGHIFYNGFSVGLEAYW